MNAMRRLVAAAILLLAFPRSFTFAGEKEEIPVKMTVGAEWVAPPPSAGPLAAVRILRAIDPKTGKFYVTSYDDLGCDPKRLRRAFRLARSEFLLGEPIAVELRIELEGPGRWREPIGGNYRARGRDDNFLFLMRRRRRACTLARGTSSLGSHA